MRRERKKKGACPKKITLEKAICAASSLLPLKRKEKKNTTDRKRERESEREREREICADFQPPAQSRGGIIFPNLFLK